MASDTKWRQNGPIMCIIGEYIVANQITQIMIINDFEIKFFIITKYHCSYIGLGEKDYRTCCMFWWLEERKTIWKEKTIIEYFVGIACIN